MRFASRIAATTAVLSLLAGGCGDDKDWDQEIIAQIFKPKNLDVGRVTVTAVQETKKGVVNVNDDGGFFRSCETNRVRIIPFERGGTHPDVTLTASSGKVSVSVTVGPLKVPTSGMVEMVLGTGSLFDPPDCQPRNVIQPKPTGSACTAAGDCAGGRCLATLVDGSNTYKFPGGYCTKTPKGGTCSTGTCGTGDQCYEAKDGWGKVTDAVCLKVCTGPKDCRESDGYQCTPSGSVCFPK